MTLLDEQPSAAEQADFDIAVALNISLGRVATALEHQQHLASRLNQLIYPVDLPPVPWQLSGGSSVTVLDQPELFGPKLGTTWDIRRLVFTAAGAGSMNVCRNSPFGDVLVEFTAVAAGTQTTFIPAKALLLRGGERLVFVASATGVATSIGVGGLSIDHSVLGLHLL
jgi:hypothetical protein